MVKILTAITVAQCVMVFLSCKWGKPPDERVLSHRKEIERWRDRRLAALKDDSGWLSLAGLFWLHEGENSFGSGPDNDLVFPTDRAPEVIGSFFLEKHQVRVSIVPQVQVLHKGESVDRMVLKSDENGDPTILSLGSLSWYVIKRGEQMGIRLKDSDHPRIREFTGIESFPIDPEWAIPARYKPFEKPEAIAVPTVLGTVEELTSPGILEFQIHDQTYRLDAVAEPDDDRFWLIFGDETNGISTYVGGRYLYVDRPRNGNKTVIDFNKAYNPPCVFSVFATCPLPLQRNRLSAEITAGEKNYGNGPH